MDRVAVFVDAGYLFAQGSVLLAGKRLTRGELLLDHEVLVRKLTELAQSLAGVPLLRIYWYDGTSTGPTPQHLTMAHLASVKLRLGFVNSVGEQKGVDSLIVTDMITLARNRAISDAVLLSGDEDIRVGVQQAQEFGARVHLVGVKPSRGSQSLFLLQESDTTHEWQEADVRAFLSIRDRLPAEIAGQVIPTAGDGSSLDALAREVESAISSTDLPALLAAHESTRQVPQEVDKQLLAGGRRRLGRDLNADEKRRIREAFILHCRERVNQGA